MAERLAGRAAVVQVNTEDNQLLSGRFGVRSIPLIMLLQQGRVIDQLAGAQTVDAVLSWFHRKAGIK